MIGDKGVDRRAVAYQGCERQFAVQPRRYDDRGDADDQREQGKRCPAARSEGAGGTIIADCRRLSRPSRMNSSLSGNYLVFVL